MSEPNNETPQIWRFTHHAMACTWQLFIAGEEREYAENVSYVAWDEVDRLERELSRYIAASDVSQVNAAAPGEWVNIGMATLECLLLAREIHDATGGAFDVTLGAVLDARLTEEGVIGAASQSEAEPERGMNLLEIDAENMQVAWHRAGAGIDLGAIGKGYTVDALARVLEDWSVGSALIHSGQSTALAIGTPPNGENWPLQLRDPLREEGDMGTAHLRDRALSGSGMRLHGAHIINPRSGQAAEGKLGAWALSHSAARSDALSTAFMVMSPDEIAAYCTAHPTDGALLLVNGENGPRWLSYGACANSSEATST
jgi:thiamine biosynthesis lipoprotein